MTTSKHILATRPISALHNHYITKHPKTVEQIEKIGLSDFFVKQAELYLPMNEIYDRCETILMSGGTIPFQAYGWFLHKKSYLNFLNTYYTKINNVYVVIDFNDKNTYPKLCSGGYAVYEKDLFEDNKFNLLFDARTTQHMLTHGKMGLNDKGAVYNFIHAFAKHMLLRTLHKDNLQLSEQAEEQLLNDVLVGSDEDDAFAFLHNSEDCISVRLWLKDKLVDFVNETIPNVYKILIKGSVLQIIKYQDFRVIEWEFAKVTGNTQECFKSLVM